MHKPVRVFAPASVANIAVGYDILGFALGAPGDEIVVRFSPQPGLRISRITGAGDRLPYEVEKNTAGFSAMRLLEYLGETTRGIEMEIHKKMPFGSGLGSSAASAVGGVMAINELLGRPLTKQEILPFAVLGEELADGAYHADNVAPSLLGGIVLIRSNRELDIIQLPVPAQLFATVIYPEVEVLTRDARNILRREVPLEEVITQTGNLAAFISSLYTQDMELLGRSLSDIIIEPQRSTLIPHFNVVKEAALNEGALGCSISGAGPSIFALSTASDIAQHIGTAMQAIFAQAAIPSQLFIGPINQEGATRIA